MDTHTTDCDCVSPRGRKPTLLSRPKAEPCAPGRGNTKTLVLVDGKMARHPLVHGSQSGNLNGELRRLAYQTVRKAVGFLVPAGTTFDDVMQSHMTALMLAASGDQAHPVFLETSSGTAFARIVTNASGEISLVGVDF
jgi:hypothetical protein